MQITFSTQHLSSVPDTKHENVLFCDSARESIRLANNSGSDMNLCREPKIIRLHEKTGTKLVSISNRVAPVLIDPFGYP